MKVTTKSFLTAIAVVFVLMVLTYALTFIIPGGEYARIIDENGNHIIDPDSFSYAEASLPLWKWCLSPFLVLGSEGGGMIGAILVFLLVIGGVFTALDKCGLMKYMLDRIVYKFGKAKYKLLGAVSFFFMAMGAFIGSFEECIPLVPIVVALSVSLGWDALTGMGMSLLAVGCGFASGVCNPFTVGVAQGLAGLPMFSGLWYRLICFVLIYVLLLLFLTSHAKKTETNDIEESRHKAFSKDAKMDKALTCFASVLGIGILAVISSGFITALQDYTMIIVAVMFLVAGVLSVLISGVGASFLFKSFGAGMIDICPAILLILMASSVKYTLTEAKILDTILHYAVESAGALPKWLIILFIYLIVLILNFFISSGSAKAFLLIPLIVPMAQVFGIEPQLCVLAFAFGDGFSNVIYPTNAALLISLGLADVSYTKWAKFTLKFQIANLVLTSLLLLLGLALGYR